MIQSQTQLKAVRESAPRAAPSSRLVRKGTPTRDELEAEVLDPYAMGWDAAADLDEPPPCPFVNGVKARLWRRGFAERVQAYVAATLSRGGLGASLS